MFKVALSVLAAAVLAGPAYAQSVGFDYGRGIDLQEALSAITVPMPSVPQAGSMRQKAPAEWTVMVFMNGKNDLEWFALKDINEMELAGSTDKVNIVVETGRMDGYDNSDGNWKGTRRYFITKDTDTTHVSSRLVADLGKTDMGDYKSLAAFGRWAKEKYPAKKYMLIVWNHGSGWEKGVKSSAKSISFDDETKNHINTPQLGLALKEIGKVDIYASDACLMQMAEVDYELRNYADYLVGSEESEGNDGYPYDVFLSSLAARPETAPVELAKGIVDAYYNYYKKHGPATHSVIKAAALQGLVEKVNAWTGAVMAAGLKKEVQIARNEAMSYVICANKDLYHFVSLVSCYTTNSAVRKATEGLQNYIDKELVISNRFVYAPEAGGGWDQPEDNGQNYSNSYGLAAYVPESAAGGAGYNELAWAKASNWDEFTAWYMAK